MDEKWQWEVAEPPAGHNRAVCWIPEPVSILSKLDPASLFATSASNFQTWLPVSGMGSHKSKDVTVALGNVGDKEGDRLIRKIFLNTFWSNHFGLFFFKKKSLFHSVQNFQSTENIYENFKGKAEKSRMSVSQTLTWQNASAAPCFSFFIIQYWYNLPLLISGYSSSFARFWL